MVENCSQSNHSSDSLHLSCSSGYDGGLSQIFTLELYQHATETLVRNMTTVRSPPAFHVNHLKAGFIFDAHIYASNRMGSSASLRLKVSTLKRPSEKRLATTASGGGGSAATAGKSNAQKAALNGQVYPLQDQYLTSSPV